MQRQQGKGRQTRLVTVGKKAASYFRFRGWAIDAHFQGFADQPAYEDARSIAEFVVTQFEEAVTWSSWPTPSSCRPRRKRV